MASLRNLILRIRIWRHLQILPRSMHLRFRFPHADREMRIFYVTEGVSGTQAVKILIQTTGPAISVGLNSHSTNWLYALLLPVPACLWLGVGFGTARTRLKSIYTSLAVLGLRCCYRWLSHAAVDLRHPGLRNYRLRREAIR